MDMISFGTISVYNSAHIFQRQTVFRHSFYGVKSKMPCVEMISIHPFICSFIRPSDLVSVTEEFVKFA